MRRFGRPEQVATGTCDGANCLDLRLVQVAEASLLHRWVEVNTNPAPTLPVVIGAAQVSGAQSTSDGGLAFIRSDAQMPGRVFVKTMADELKDVSGSLIPAAFPGARLVTPLAVTFNATDGMKISGQLDA